MASWDKHTLASVSEGGGHMMRGAGFNLGESEATTGMAGTNRPNLNIGQKRKFQMLVQL